MMTEPETPPTRQRLFVWSGQFSFAEVAQMLGALGALVTIIRLVAISHGDTQTAVTVLQYGGFLSPITSSVLNIAPWLGTQVCIFAYLHSRALKEARKPVPWELARHTATYLWFAVLIYFFNGFDSLLYVGLYFVVVAFETRSLKRARKTGTPVSPDEYIQIRKREYVTERMLPLISTLPLLIGAATSPFGVQERITVAHNPTPLYGSVVGTKDDWTLIIDTKAHIHYVKSEDINERDVCRESDLQPVLNWPAGIFLHTSSIRCPGT
jgi:hypothetical protein